jgi:hypothetical protein
MASTNAALSALFYVSAVLFGKYVLMNLLTAILVENYAMIQVGVVAASPLEGYCGYVYNTQTHNRTHHSHHAG